MQGDRGGERERVREKGKRDVYIDRSVDGNPNDT